MASRTSAGILVFRRSGGGLEVLLAHPGGPFFARKDAGCWTIPKGAPGGGEEPEAAARRELEEETGLRLDEATPLVPLGSVRQKGGKVVTAWAAEADLDPAEAHGNTFELEWPPRSGSLRVFPEIDRVAWFEPAEAAERIVEAQRAFVERLETALSSPPQTEERLD